MGRKVRRVPVSLDAKGVQPLSHEELKTILRGADDLILQGGRSLLARVLKGSKQKAVLEKGLDRSPVYGAMRELSLDEITRRIDWTIKEGYLAIEYDYRLPLLRYTRIGWAIEREIYATELLERIDRELEIDPAQPDLEWFGDQHPEVLELVAETIAQSGDAKYEPVLEAWQGRASRRMRRHVRAAIRALQAT
ncbi:MAG TPA: RQC-minor-1 family DNA-binding protein [Pseudohaliea sp.]|nr:RQC-minor-1 family DNA-binding protein [Pseudohaliea sp.]